MAVKKPKTIPWKCSGCGINFALDAGRYRTQSVWGKTEFFCTSKCAGTYHYHYRKYPK